MKGYLLILLSVFLILGVTSIPVLASTTTLNNLQVSITNEKHDLVDHSIDLEVKNLLDYGRDFNLGFYLQNLNFDKAGVSDVFIYEWKPIAYSFPIYDMKIVERECVDNKTMQSYDCSYTDTYQSGTYIKDILTWKPTKMALITQAAKISSEYGNILIPKVTSKAKFDDNLDAYDYDGIKKFRITWKTPIIKTTTGYGSSGYFGVYDKLSGFDYDPWWNSSFSYCKNITITDISGGSYSNPGFPIEKQINTSGHALSGGQDIRVVNASCGNDGDVIPYGLRKNGADDFTVAFKTPITALGTVTYSVYYGCAACDFANTTYEKNANNWFAGSEDGTAGLDDDNWLVENPGGTDKIDDLLFYNGTRSTYFISSDNTFYMRANSSSVTDPVPKITNYTWVEIAIYRNVTEPDYYISVGDEDTGKRCGIITVGGSSEPLYYYDGTTRTAVGKSMALSVWYIFQYMVDITQNTFNASIMFGENRSSIWSADNIACFDASFGNDASEIWIDGASSGKSIIIDNALMKRWLPTAKMPTISLGTEETYGGNQAPRWSGNTTTYPIVFNPSNATKFNLTWANGSASAITNTTNVFLESNISGTPYNYTMVLISGNGFSGVYGYSGIVGAGGYYWRSYAKTNDSIPLWNITPNWTFSIAQYSSSCWLNTTVTPPVNDSSVAYPNTITAYGGCNNPEGAYALWMNNTNISSLNNTPTLWGVGYYFFKTNVSNTQNYSSSQAWQTVYVTQGNLSTYMSITYNTSSTVSTGTPVLVNCNYPSEVSVNMYNDTASVGTPYAFDTTGLTGTYNFTCNSTGNTNYTSGTTTNSVIVTSGSGLSVNVFNEENTTHALSFNITINNGTVSNTAYNQNNPYINSSVLGSLTIEISADGYQTRTYYENVVSGNATTLNASLLATTSGSWVLFYTYTISEQPIPFSNCLINAERLLPPASYSTIGQKKTDASGSASIFLDTTVQYRINASCLGHDTQSFLVYPAASPYVIYYGAFNLSYNTTYKNLYFYTLPVGTGLKTNTSYNFNYFIYSSDSMLSWYGWVIRTSDGKLINSTNVSGATGGNLSMTANTVNNTSVVMHYWFKKQGFSLVNMSNTYYVYNVTYTNTTLWATIQDIKAQGTGWEIDANAFAIISLICTIVFMAGVSSKTQMFGSGLFGLVLFAAFTFAGTYIYGSAYIVGWEMLLLMAIAVIAAIYNRGGFG